MTNKYKYEDTLEYKIRCLPIFGTNKLLLTDVTDTVRDHEAELISAIRKMRNALLLAEKEWRNVDTFELEEESPYERLILETEKFV